jgi:hypothetical protein
VFLYRAYAKHSYRKKRIWLLVLLWVFSGETCPHTHYIYQSSLFSFQEILDLQSKRYSPAEKALLICKMPLHDILIGVWCAVSSTRIIGIYV